MLQELEEIHIDLANTLNGAVESHALLLLTKVGQRGICISMTSITTKFKYAKQHLFLCTIFCKVQVTLLHMSNDTHSCS